MSERVETLSGDPGLELPEFDAPPEEPLSLLERWLTAAGERGVREPRALALATADVLYWRETLQQVVFEAPVEQP